tara:strand:+ start:13118 stop:13432 length:315 start_codon:yes stop_codon:yes gene_type:complete
MTDKRITPANGVEFFMEKFGEHYTGTYLLDNGKAATIVSVTEEDAYLHFAGCETIKKGYNIDGVYYASMTEFFSESHGYEDAALRAGNVARTAMRDGKRIDLLQ